MSTKFISSKTNPVVKEIVSLRDNKNLSKSPFFVAEGRHLLEIALKEGLVIKVFSKNELPFEVDENIEQYIVSEDVLKKLSNEKTPNDIVFLARKKTPEPIKDNFVIYLDNVQDPGNVGTIIRTALAFSFKEIILSKGSASLYNNKTIQSAQGALFSTNINNDDENRSLLKSLKSSGYKILVTTLDEDSLYLDEFSFDKNEKYVLVLGNEGRGVSKEVIDLKDSSIKIKISNIDSLNVAIAGGILLNYFSYGRK